MGPQRRTPWPVGGAELVAECVRGHPAPAHDCGCGLHAWHPRPRSARRIVSIRGHVGGVMEASGAIEVHEDGLRAERARPRALVATPGRNEPMVRRLAAVYGVEVIEARRPQEVLDWCRARDLGLGERTVAELLGESPATLSAWRRARALRLALRVATVAAAVAVMLALGIVLTGDPGDRPLFGRGGEVHRQR